MVSRNEFIMNISILYPFKFESKVDSTRDNAATVKLKMNDNENIYIFNYYKVINLKFIKAFAYLLVYVLTRLMAMNIFANIMCINFPILFMKN